jgi:hypothetical protein
MRNQLIAFCLPFVFAAKAFAAPAGSACDWVDQEALVELGLANSVPKESPVGRGASCTFAAPDVPIPSLIVTVQLVSDDFVLKPVCNWGTPQFSSVELGICYMNIGHASVGFTLMVTQPSTSAIQSALSAQVERLFNKHVEAAPK